MEDKKKTAKKKTKKVTAKEPKVKTQKQKDVASIFETSPSNEKSVKKSKTIDENKKLLEEIEKTVKINVEKIVEEQTKLKDEEQELKVIEKEKYKGIIYFLLSFLFLCLILMVYTINNTNARVKSLEEAIEKEITKTDYVSPTTVFFGDSIISRYDLGKYFKDAKYINNATGGFKTEDVLDGLTKDVLNYHPQKAFLLIGTNDINKEIETDEIITNIEKTINRIKTNNKNTEIYIQSILPINDSDEDKIDSYVIGERTNEKIDEVNDLIKDLCKKNKVTYIDTNKLMQDEDGLLKLEYTTEGLHLNESGYQKLTTILTKYLK